MVYRSAQFQDVTSICRLMNSIFGVNPKAEATFAKWLEKPNFTVVIAEFEQSIVGIGAAFMDTESRIEKYETFGPRAVEFLRDQVFGTVLSLAIDPAFRRRGIGRKLAKMMVGDLKEMGCDLIIGTSWKNGSTDHSGHLFKSAGFLELGDSQEFLRQQSRQTGFVCLVCLGECRCRSRFYGARIDFL